MKKLFSLLLALVMIACMSVTLFADNSTTVLTVEVPAATPSYILHVPASVTLEYGDTEAQTIGDVYVTDVANVDRIWCQATYTDLINTSDSEDTISLDLCEEDDLWGIINKDGKFSGNVTPMLYNREKNNTVYINGYRTMPLVAKVADWSGATPGATYQATITYVIIYG